MKVTRGELKKIIAEEIKATQVEEGVVQWTKDMFTSGGEIDQMAERLEGYVGTLNKFMNNPEVGEEAKVDTYDYEADEDRGGFVQKGMYKQDISDTPEYDKIREQFKIAREALRAVTEYKSVQGFWKKPKKLDYLRTGLDAAGSALSTISKLDRSYAKAAYAAIQDAKAAGKVRATRRGREEAEAGEEARWAARAGRRDDKERARERAREKANRPLQFTGGQMSTHSPYQESVSQDKLKKIIAEELKSVLGGK